MEITFSIKYKAEWGQRLCISGSHPELGNNSEGNEALELHAISSDEWRTTISVPSITESIDYYYFVKSEDGTTIRREWKRLHQLDPIAPAHHILVEDIWLDRPSDSALYSSAFVDVLHRHVPSQRAQGTQTSNSRLLTLQVHAPSVARDARLCLSGSSPSLGNWSVDNALAMEPKGKGLWQITLPYEQLFASNDDIEYKFFASSRQRITPQWEEGPNRILHRRAYDEYDRIVTLCSPAYIEGAEPKFAGIVIPLFALRHTGDWGIGDFGSLAKMVDWASRTSLSLVQLLPINDTTYFRDWRDSYPYNAISVDALHPIYIDINSLAPLKDKAKEHQIRQRATSLSALPSLDYPRVLALKEEYLEQHYIDHGASLIGREAFQAFCTQNAEWLDTYVAYCILRDEQPGQPPQTWKAYKQHTPDILRELLSDEGYRHRAQYHRYVQYLLYDQLKRVSDYARTLGIVLKGDIAIGVAPHGADAWARPELFHMSQSAGAPPDAFALDGQNWGFPTYNWEQLGAEGFAWWHRRLHGMAQYFQAVRIDHILGFFRIWEIPRSQHSGLLGHFYPALPLDEPYWAQEFGSVGSVQGLAQPFVYATEAIELFGVHLDALVRQGHLRPSDTPEGYYLAYAQSQEWDSIPESDIAGGAESRAQLLSLCREVALVADPRAEGYYHPRIAFEQSLRFQHWDELSKQKWQTISHHYFYEKHNELYKQTALSRLAPILEGTEMLICAEDLGMIPSSVPEVLEQLQILSLDLERMPKVSSPSPWYSPHTYPYLSICTTSTHDMPPLRLWWRQLDEMERESYLRHLYTLNPSLMGQEMSDEEILHTIVKTHLSSSSMFTILPLSDWMSICTDLHLQTPEQEQINHPEDPLHQWSYRIPISIEDLRAQHPKWIAQVQTMIHETNRR